MTLTIKNWDEFQHYKDRSPPWIKLHKGLLDNFEYQCLPVASRALAPMLWLLASENILGEITDDPRVIGFRLRMTINDVVEALEPLIQAGFVISDSNVLATRKHHAIPETETETETETDARISKPTSKAKNQNGSADGFDFFYEAYGKKVSKLKAEQAWGKIKLDDDLIKLIISSATAYAKTITEKRFQKDPATWLNGKCWNDELPSGYSAKPNQSFAQVDF